MLRCYAGYCLLLLLFVPTTLIGAVKDVQKVIIDTDFAMPPQDDALALMLALNSPELEILGVTTVAGNRSQQQAVADLLRFLEIVDRKQLPVYSGADRPLFHKVSEYAVKSYGEWYVSDPPQMPHGGFASKTVELQSAADFLVQTCERYPQEVSIIAIGPLTNLAIAMRQDRDFPGQVKKLYIMGGAIANLPDGGGNLTPNAEFNFWVDPEAARSVLRSGIPIELSPLNVSRKTGFKKKHFEAIVRIDTPFTRLLDETTKAIFEVSPNRELLMYDQVVVASAIDPTLVCKLELFVDVDTNPGINYGVSVGGTQPWPGSEGARKISVQHDLDWDRFIALFIERVAAPF